MTRVKKSHSLQNLHHNPVVKDPSSLQTVSRTESGQDRFVPHSSPVEVQPHTTPSETGGVVNQLSLLEFLLGRDTEKSVSFYKGKDLHITSEESDALEKGDLNAFWSSRLGKDPVARIALGIWGGDKAIEKGIEEIDKEYWLPSVNLLSNVALQFQKPGDVKANPSTPEELKKYWLWLGQDAREHVERFLNKGGFLKGAEDPVALEKSLMRKIGLQIAKEHAAEVRRDTNKGQGEIPGLLSRDQIADYHHRALEAFELPPEAYGGTPLSFVPDFLELWLVGGIYAHDADPSE